MAGFRHCFPLRRASAVLPSAPFLYLFNRSAACLGSHVKTGSSSVKTFPIFSSKADLNTRICRFTSRMAFSTIPFAWWSPGGDSSATASIAASLAAAVFKATMEWLSIWLQHHLLNTLRDRRKFSCKLRQHTALHPLSPQRLLRHIVSSHPLSLGWASAFHLASSTPLDMKAVVESHSRQHMLFALLFLSSGAMRLPNSSSRCKAVLAPISVLHMSHGLVLLDLCRSRILRCSYPGPAFQPQSASSNSSSASIGSSGGSGPFLRRSRSAADASFAFRSLWTSHPLHSCFDLVLSHLLFEGRSCTHLFPDTPAAKPLSRLRMPRLRIRLDRPSGLSIPVAQAGHHAASSTAIRPYPKHLCADINGLCTSAIAPLYTAPHAALSETQSKVPVPSLGTNSPDAVLKTTSPPGVTVTLSCSPHLGDGCLSSPCIQVESHPLIHCGRIGRSGCDSSSQLSFRLILRSNNPTSASGAGSPPASGSPSSSPPSNPDTCFLPFWLALWTFDCPCPEPPLPFPVFLLWPTIGCSMWPLLATVVAFDVFVFRAWATWAFIFTFAFGFTLVLAFTLGLSFAFTCAFYQTRYPLGYWINIHWLQVPNLN